MKTAPNNRGRPAPLAVRDPLPIDQRIERRMPSNKLRATLYQRDGWRCRFCSVRVVDPRALKELTQAFPAEARWGTGNANCHTGLLVLRASPDHVVPHCHGGDNSMENMVTACFVCQFARGELLLAEARVKDPESGHRSWTSGMGLCAFADPGDSNSASDSGPARGPFPIRLRWGIGRRKRAGGCASS